MTKNDSTKNTAVNDVVAEAEKANLLNEEKTIPKQVGLNNANVPDGGNEAGYTEDEDLCGEVDNSKLSFGARLKATAEKLKANKKNVIITLAVVGAAAVAVAKFAAKTVVEEVVESASEDLTDEEKKSIQDDLDANDNAA